MVFPAISLKFLRLNIYENIHVSRDQIVLKVNFLTEVWSKQYSIERVILFFPITPPFKVLRLNISESIHVPRAQIVVMVNY